jgi:hypothetical protein
VPGLSLSYLPQWALHFGDAPSHTTVMVRLPVLTTIVFSAVLPGAEYAGSVFTGRGIFLERGPAAIADVIAMTEITMSEERRSVFMGFRGAWFKRESLQPRCIDPYPSEVENPSRYFGIFIGSRKPVISLKG